MTYQLIVSKDFSQEVMTKIISLPRRDVFRRKFSMHDSHDGKTVEITFAVDSFSVDVKEMEKLLNEAVASSESNVITSWKKLD